MTSSWSISLTVYLLYIDTFIFVLFLVREECNNYGFVITFIIALAQYTLVQIFVIYENSTIVFVVCAMGPFLLTSVYNQTVVIHLIKVNHSIVNWIFKMLQIPFSSYCDRSNRNTNKQLVYVNW